MQKGNPESNKSDNLGLARREKLGCKVNKGSFSVQQFGVLEL